MLEQRLCVLIYLRHLKYHSVVKRKMTSYVLGKQS